MSIHTDLSIVPISVAPSPAASGTSLGVTDANAALLPDIYPWWALVKPSGEAPTRVNSEILKITDGVSAAGTTTYTMVREQGLPVTDPRTIIVGDDILEVHSAQKQIDTDFNQIDPSPATDHSIGEGSHRMVMNANEAQNFGDVCFRNSDSQAQLVDADAIASGLALAMCADASISANDDGNYLMFGTARDDTWNWTPGGLIYITVTGTTGNTLSQTPPTGTDDVVLPVGIALTADIMFFKPGLLAIELM